MVEWTDDDIIYSGTIVSMVRAGLERIYTGPKEPDFQYLGQCVHAVWMGARGKTVDAHSDTWQGALVKILDGDVEASYATHRTSPVMAVLFLPAEKKFVCIPGMNMGRPYGYLASAEVGKHMAVVFNSSNYAKLENIQKSGGFVVEVIL